ncbi:MAG: Polysaccharide biosynthesis protein [Candidatus Woesebacteria bacterium GW2011_GWA2_40_7b]|uniref:Polysaccharide biosynthesis protein n=1 Tax=Candidatus Woesebacteria bacterium GW2011_GWA2_40_7b TaxID=1618563 RepID=A0A0G0VHB1_9BACT|nr:MAG: Polysaccharide biosynthesis protein [Candidatus Woesebacteria bacterium GW2011_GWA2_40_7b]
MDKLLKEMKNLFTSKLFTGSIIMLVGTNFVNFLAYIYHLFFGRILGPSLYGELAAIISLISLFTSIFGFFSVVIVKFVSMEDNEGRKRLFSWLGGIIKKVAIVCSVILLLSYPLIAKILFTNSLSAIQVGLIMFFTFFIIFNNSFLEGLLRFKELVIVGMVTWSIRIVAGYLLFRLGFSLSGVVFAILVSNLVSAWIGKNFVRIKGVKFGSLIYEKRKEIVKYALPVLIMTVATGAFISQDVVLARYFLSPHDSGIYAALATMGKMVLYASVPIIGVMFPLVSQSHTKGFKTGKILLLSGMATFFVGLFVVALYHFFPETAVRVLYGQKYLTIVPYLGRIGIVYLIYSLDLLLVSYFLSRSKVVPAYLTLILALTQVIGITLFHSGIGQIVNVSTFSVLLLFGALNIYSVAKLGK